MSKAIFQCPLWSINKWMRWTGFRLFITEHTYEDGDHGWSVGIAFYGWKGLRP